MEPQRRGVRYFIGEEGAGGRLGPAGALLLYLTIGWVIASPWLLGAVEEWAALTVVILVLAGGGMLELAGVGRPPWLPGELRVAGLLAFLLAAFLVFQAVPLWSALIARMSPEAYRLQGAASVLLAGATGKDVVLPRVSLAPPDTWRRLAAFLAAWVGFLAGMWVSRSERRRSRIVRVWIFSAVLLVVEGLIQSLGREGLIYGFYEPRYGGRVLGVFTNRNHFASYLNLMLGLGLGWLGLSREQKRWRLHVDPYGARDRLLMWFGAVVVMVVGVLFSLSRGGILGMAVCLGVFWALVPRRSSRGVMVSLSSLAVFIGLGLGVWAVGGQLVERFLWLRERTADLSAALRMAAVRDALGLFRRFCLVGCGAGAFQHVFPAFSSGQVAVGRWTHLHNDYVEWLCEGGLVGTLLAAGLAASILWLAVRCWRCLLRGERWLAAGLAGGLAGLLAHSAVDYGLHRVTHWLGGAVLLGLLCGMLVRARARQRPPRPPRTVGPRVEGLLRGAALTMLAVGLWYWLSGVRAEVVRARVWQLTENRRNFNGGWEREWAARAVERDLEGLDGNRGATADVLLEAEWCALQWVGEWEVSPERRIRLARLAGELGARAAVRAPANYECWLWLSRAERVAGSRRRASAYLRRARALVPEGMIIVE